MSELERAITAERATLADDAEVYPVAVLAAGIPLELASAVMIGMGEVLGRAGWDAHFREATGLGVVWVRRRAA